MKNTPLAAGQHLRSPDPLDHLIGQKLGEQRARKNISRDELARALRLSTETIRLVEAGEAPLGALSLYEACEILEVSMMYFFQDGKDVPQSNGAQVPSETLVF